MGEISPEKTELIRMVVKESVEETLTALGVDAEHPIDVQKDMAHLRASRMGAENTKQLVKRATVPIVVVAVLGAAWAGFGEAISEIVGKGR